MAASVCHNERNLKKLYGLFLWMGFNCLKAAEPLRGVYFFPLSPQEFLVLIWSTLEGWKAQSTLKPPSGLEPETPELGIQCPNHQPIYKFKV